MKIRCEKCRATLGRESAFAILVTMVDGSAEGGIVRVASLREGDIALHVNGDQQCLRKTAGYRILICEKLHSSDELDLNFLDTM